MVSGLLWILTGPLPHHCATKPAVLLLHDHCGQPTLRTSCAVCVRRPPVSDDGRRALDGGTAGEGALLHAGPEPSACAWVHECAHPQRPLLVHGCMGVLTCSAFACVWVHGCAHPPCLLLVYGCMGMLTCSALLVHVCVCLGKGGAHPKRRGYKHKEGACHKSLLTLYHRVLARRPGWWALWHPLEALWHPLEAGHCGTI